MIRQTRRWPSRCSVPLLLALTAPAPAATLQDALSGALARAAPDTETTLPEASSWLAAVPTVAGSHTETRAARGTDETGVSLNLPIKSGTRRRLDRALRELETRSAGLYTRFRQWVYSEPVRERAWAYRLAMLDLDAASEKQALLARLAEQFSRQAASGAIPVYSSLIVERARLDAELALDAARLAVRREQDAFTALTGLAEVPGALTEVAPQTPAYDEHPALRRLELDRARERTVLHLSAPDTASWNLSLVARSFEGPEFTDEQLELAFEVPLNFLGTQSTGNRSQRSAARRAYLLARDRLRLALRDRWRALVTEGERLARRQTLLQQAAGIADRIEAQISALKTRNEIEGEIRLQRMLDVLETRAALARTQALRGRNIARKRQAAGLAL